MARKTRDDSLAGELERRRNLHRRVEPPEGVVLETEQEKLIWEQYTSARSPEMWRKFDLIQVFDMVRLRVQILEIDEKLENEGMTVTAGNGVPTISPLVKVKDLLAKQHMAILRSLSLGIKADGARAMNNSGKRYADVVEAEAAKKADKNGRVLNLLA